MRADAHYVDQLESPAPPVIRLLAVSQIESTDLPTAAAVDALTRSIRAHGVLQPLLIRRHAGRYSLIAGRKRLAAAIAAGVAAVPCVLHDIDAAAVAAVADAENLRVDDAARMSTAEKQAAQGVMQALTADLSTIRTSLTLLKTRQRGLAQKVASDLIEAQAARAEWIVACVAGTFENSRPSSLAAIVQRVADTFIAHTTLSGLQLEPHVTPAAATWRLPEDAALAVIKGAVFATLAMIEGSAAQKIELHADSTLRGTLKIDVVQRVSVLAQQPEHDPIVALALRTARALVEPQGGAVELTALPGHGSQLQITFGN
jgi:ParB/RepB/Spo0J family partition protein